MKLHAIRPHETDTSENGKMCVHDNLKVIFEDYAWLVTCPTHIIISRGTIGVTLSQFSFVSRGLYHFP